MRGSILLTVLTATAALAPLAAQTEQRQATVRGGGGDDGKYNR
jgi:hypothetical protein